VEILVVSGCPQSDKNLMESKKSIVIVMVLALLNDGQQVDYRISAAAAGTNKNTMHYKIKYVTEEITGHISR